MLIKPLRAVVFIFFIWKMGSEIAYPHYAFFEWVERGGSYGTLLALWVITGGHSALNYTLTGYHALRKAFVGGAY